MRPVPWFWIVRVALSSAAAVTWSLTHPHASAGQLIWQELLAVLAVIAVAEYLRSAYRREQARIRNRCGP